MANKEMADILKNLKHPDAEMREMALERLGELRPANALELIVPLLLDADSEVRGTAASTLGIISDSRAVPHLIEVVDSDPSEEVRSDALKSLTDYRGPNVFDCLLREVRRNKRSRRPRWEVARQLGYYDREESIEALKTLLQDDDVYVRILASDSLYLLNRAGLRKTWLEALDDSSEYVHEIAKKALAEIDNSED